MTSGAKRFTTIPIFCGQANSLHLHIITMTQSIDINVEDNPFYHPLIRQLAISKGCPCWIMLDHKRLVYTSEAIKGGRGKYVYEVEMTNCCCAIKESTL